MATNLNLDDRLIQQALRLGKHRSKQEAVTAALEGYIALQKELGILELFGKVDYDPSYDYTQARRTRRR